MPKDNALEKDIQNRFFDILMAQKEGFENTNIYVYQHLVYNRYEEVIKNSFPLFLEHINEEDLEDSIRLFMESSPKTPFVWKAANDYRKFVKKQKLFDKKKYLYELLYYDWIEIELSMTEYKNKNLKKFSFKNSYKLSNSSRIKKFKYNIINSEHTTKRENFLVIYYDFKSDDVIYREINQLIFELFKRVNKNETIGKSLKKLCKENDIDYKEAKNFLAPALKELYKNKVFI